MKRRYEEIRGLSGSAEALTSNVKSLAPNIPADAGTRLAHLLASADAQFSRLLMGRGRKRDVRKFYADIIAEASHTLTRYGF